MDGNKVDADLEAEQGQPDHTDALLGIRKTTSPSKTPLTETAPAEGPAKCQDAGTDTLDARLSGMTIAAPMEADDSKFMYNMNHKNRGLFYIINNKRFHPSTGMNERSGTDADAANLYQRFKELGFEIKIYKDLSTVQMLKLMTDAAKIDHTNSDCFGCALLSHGDDGVVYGTDGIIQIDMLVAPFKGQACPSLLGKPKLFFIQACRGSQLDHGAEVMADADTEEEKVYRIPSEADFLYAYSTVPGYFSWRNSTKGSWFVQSLCKNLQEYGTTRDLAWIMTRVNYTVAYEFQSNASKEYMNKKKQIPSIVSMLTKDLIFKNKH